MKIIYFAIVLLSYGFAEANSVDNFPDEFFFLDDETAIDNGSHLFIATNFNVDLTRNKTKVSDILSVEVDSLIGKDDKINLNIGSLLLNQSNFDLGLSRDWAKEPLFELGYKAITTSRNSTFWLDGLYKGDLDCSVAFCKNSHDLDWSAGARFDFTRFSITGMYKNKKKNDVSFNKFKAGVIKPDASFEDIQRGGYQLLGKYEVTRDTRLNFTLGDVPVEYDSNDNFEVYRSNYQKSLWTVGVHHDVNSWLKIVAEYNRAQYGINNSNDGKEDSISVGGVLKW